MIERGCCSGFSEQSPFGLFIGDQCRWQEFDRHLAREFGIFRQVNFTHPACAQRGEDAVVVDLLSDKRGRGLRRDDFGGYFVGGRFDKAPGLLVSIEQLLNFITQRIIAITGLRQKSCALACLVFERLLKDYFDLLPSFRGHGRCHGFTHD